MTLLNCEQALEKDGERKAREGAGRTKEASSSSYTKAESCGTAETAAEIKVRFYGNS